MVQRYTHIAMGIYLFLLIDRLAVVEQRMVLFGVLLAGSLLPDLDLATSTLGKKAKLIGEVFRHRGFIHSVWMLALIALMVHAVFGVVVYTLAVALAFGFHILLDAFTPKGVKPFWVGPRLRGFIKTGSVMDKFLFVFLIIVSTLMLFKVI